MADERADHSVQRQQRLVGQKCQFQQDCKIGSKEVGESVPGHSHLARRHGANQPKAQFDPGWNK